MTCLIRQEALKRSSSTGPTCKVKIKKDIFYKSKEEMEQNYLVAIQSAFQFFKYSMLSQ